MTLYHEPIRAPGRDLNLERLKAETKRLEWQNAWLEDCVKFLAIVTVLHLWIRFLWWTLN